MSNWHDNGTALFGCSPRMGGLWGFCGSINMGRHDPSSCRPGFWFVAMNCGNEIFDFFGVTGSRSAAVVDDFGNLVGVPS